MKTEGRQEFKFSVFHLTSCLLVCLKQDEGGGWGGDTYADPWVLEGLLSSDPLGWVDGQHLVDQVFGLGGDCVPLRGGELGRRNIILHPPTGAGTSRVSRNM